MFGILLILIGSVFDEAGTVIGKFEVAHKKESLYAMGFLGTIWATMLFGLTGWWMGLPFVFVPESLPTFLLRAVMEVVLMFVVLHAVLAADRSTFSFLRILTIPLLLATDLLLGYVISPLQMAGVVVIVCALVFLLLNHGLSRKGKFLTLLGAVLAVGTASLYKYDITHFNSITAEQMTLYSILLGSLLFAGRWYAKENLFRYLLKPVFLFQSLAAGFGALAVSFAFLFAPASIVMAAKRAFEVLTSIVSGNRYFHEKHPLVKLTGFCGICIGVALIALG